MNLVLQRFNKFIFASIGLIVLLHGMTLYAVQAADADITAPQEQTQDVDEEEQLLQVYEALIPTFQGMSPLVLYFINEVALLSESEFQEITVPDLYQNHLLQVLFPRIISPNAP